MAHSSDHFNGRIFLNPVPTEVMKKGAFFRVLKKYFQKDPAREPLKPLGPFKIDLNKISNLPQDALRITWLGHSSTLLEINGMRLLTDPVWYHRASPFLYMGPKRFFENPLQKDDLPAIDYVLLSHDHYDHLDRASLLFLVNEKRIPVITMLGVGGRLIQWGVDKKLVTQLDWWQEASLPGGLHVIATPARHFSGRSLNDRFTTLWGSFVIKGPKHKVYFGADSGYYEGFKTIGERYGPFDLVMLETGGYFEEWPNIHMLPESAVQAHFDLGGKLLMPLHWATYGMSFHPWKEPVERLVEEALKRNVPLLLPAPGDTIDVGMGAFNSHWWEGYE